MVTGGARGATRVTAGTTGIVQGVQARGTMGCKG